MFWRSGSVRLCIRIPTYNNSSKEIWVQQRSEEFFFAQFVTGHVTQRSEEYFFAQFVTGHENIFERQCSL